VTDKLQDTASRVVDTVQDTAAPVLDQAGERASQVADQVMDQATSRLDMGKELAVETLDSVAQALRQTGQHLREDSSQPTLGQYADTGAETLERFTGYLRQRDANQLLAEVESFARRNPLTFAGGAFAFGLLTARFFRSSARRAQPSSAMGRTASGHFSQLAPPSQFGTSTGTVPRPPMSQHPGPLSSAPAARHIPASPDWTPSTTGRPSTGTSTGFEDPEDDQLTPIPGSLPSPGRSSSGSTAGTRTTPSGTTPSGTTTPETMSPGQDRPESGSQPSR